VHLLLIDSIVNSIPPTGQAAEAVLLTLAIAMVLPVLGIFVYGFTIGWTALGGWALFAMAILATVYFLLLRMMMRYRKQVADFSFASAIAIAAV
jgi:hypothetical protein